jgi:hypothetical protein
LPAEPLLVSKVYSAESSWAEFLSKPPPPRSRQEMETMLCINGFSSVILGPYLSIAGSNFVNPWFGLSLRYELQELAPPVLQNLIHI